MINIVKKTEEKNKWKQNFRREQKHRKTYGHPRTVFNVLIISQLRHISKLQMLSLNIQ